MLRRVGSVCVCEWGCGHTGNGEHLRRAARRSSAGSGCDFEDRLPFGNLKPGDTFTYSPLPMRPASGLPRSRCPAARSLPFDQDGRPALVANKLGNGKTLLCAYPLEVYSPIFLPALKETINLSASIGQLEELTETHGLDRSALREASALNAKDHRLSCCRESFREAKHVNSFHVAHPPIDFRTG